jgi:hypothetical protein
MTAGANLKVIACPSLRPELDRLVIGASVHYLAMGLHERSAEALRNALQAAVDAAGECDAVAIGYGLCNRGIIGLEAHTVPLVIPRAHDCVGLLLGSSQRYLEEIDREPGTFFQNAGLLTARREGQEDLTFGPSSNANYERLAARYGDEAARYLVEQLDGFTQHYKRLAYIATSIDGAATFEDEARAIAAAKGLAYQRLNGDTGWLERLVRGDWPEEEFLIVQPGQRVVLGSEGQIEAA